MGRCTLDSERNVTITDFDSCEQVPIVWGIHQCGAAFALRMNLAMVAKVLSWFRTWV